MKHVHGQPNPFLSSFLRPVGVLLKHVYTAIVSLRNTCYTRGIFQARRLPCTVISVGNIVVGGTGKTPAVIAIAKQLQADGVRVAILLRGYKRQSREKITIVTDGEKRFCTAAESGDEADMMARLLPGIPIIVGRHRYAAGQLAITRFKSEVLLLDDGFQHRQLHRDVDIVTIDATRPFDTGQLLPVGTLREPVTALRRADMLLLTRTDSISRRDISVPIPTPIGRRDIPVPIPETSGRKDISVPISETSGRRDLLVPKPETSETGRALLREELSKLAPNTPILESVHRPTHLYRLHASGDLEQLPLNWLSGKRLLAVCGIGNPNAFVTTLNHYAPETVEPLAFPDHHAYTEADCQRIQRKMTQTGAICIVTTQKDEQKLARFADKLPIAVLAVTLVITDGELLASLSSTKLG